MNFIQRYILYAKLLKTKPVKVIRKDSPEMNFYRIEMEYKINNKQLFVNTFLDKKEKPEIFGYGASINNHKRKRLTRFYNPLMAKILYEHGQTYL